jgi:Cdc6-like AAA superfamily ATPase
MYMLMNVFDCTAPAKQKVTQPTNNLEQVRDSLLRMKFDGALPCRQNEYDDLLHKIRAAIVSATGGSIYISGVPGTGKTATVIQVLLISQVFVSTHVLFR